MKILKILGISALVLFGIYIALAAVAPSSLVIEKSVSISASPSTVFA